MRYASDQYLDFLFIFYRSCVTSRNFRDMNDIKLECVSEEKDLEVISEDLKCEKQCSQAVRKATECWK